MTEIKDETLRQLVLHWGEMGSRWGINRTVAQIQALLYFSGRSWPADEIVEALGVARSNVSTSLRELQGWGIVKPVHLMGDRREHFESIRDVWQMFEVVLDQRKRREVDPTLGTLREVSAEIASRKITPEVRQRLEDMLGFFEVMDTWYGELRRMPLASRVKLVKLGTKLQKLLR